MNWITRTPRWILLAMLGCVLLLLLVGCGIPASSGSSNASGSYSSSQQSQYNQPAQFNSGQGTQAGKSNASQVKSLDRQVQNTLQSLDRTEQDGNSVSGSDNQPLP